ncbi:MAG: tyrosine-protein phosphatase, partial [Novosphingobium sp.]|uniref:tyrosine-protein phosphatase n=1 Tax=Novosphingobium sp. TaxID=1874826 RepID=UPI003B9B6FE3
MKRLACALALGLLLAGCAPTVAEQSAAVDAPTLALSTAPNFRDIGGYRTIDGRVVKSGLAFRSDQMNLLSDADLARIAALRPFAIADLRT